MGAGNLIAMIFSFEGSADDVSSMNIFVASSVTVRARRSLRVLSASPRIHIRSSAERLSRALRVSIKTSVLS